MYVFLIDVAIAPSTVLETIPNLHKLWKLTVKVKPFGTVGSSSHIIHATIGNPYNFYGDRTPSLGMIPGTTQLQVCGPIFFPDFGNCGSVQTLPMNEYSDIEVQQIPNENDSKFIFKYNGVKVWEYRPKYPALFNNVKVYGSDPWFPSSKVFIKDYKFHSGTVLILSLSQRQ